MSLNLLRTKSIEQSLADTDEPEYQLKRTLSALDLTVFGIGVIVGAGIFTLTGRAAHNTAGPAVIISFMVAAVCCALAAMCYAEFASTVPVSGSAYTFSYAALGEIFAWIIGWDLILEMFLAVSVVAQGWSAYVGTFLDQITGQAEGSHVIPDVIAYGGNGNSPGFNVDLMAIILIGVLGVLMIIGIKESMRVNLVLVVLKIAIVLFVIIAGIAFINKDNWSPFIRPAVTAAEAGIDQPGGLTQPLLQWLSGSQPMVYGGSGIFAGAALVFFAYIGFDVVATTAEEARNPKRDLPVGIIASLVICTVLYCAVALVITGMLPTPDIPQSAALANAFALVGQPWMAIVISAGAVLGLTTVVLTMLIGSTRLIFAMSRDGLFPMGLAKVHPRFRTPWVIGIIVTVVCLIVAGFTPVGMLEEMVNIGTLSAFLMVSIAVIVLRKRRPDLPRPFHVPFMPVIPILSALICFYLMLNLAVETWMRFLVWLLIGFAVYFLYSHGHARLQTGKTLHDDVVKQMDAGVLTPPQNR
ncbi:MAG: amino acid permease [Propionibacteriaceae bacterium]|jgi:APA family basic amino acid/polyamine antiporter|nr:amino acid permease [Propionibacteriaceae bacterium]